MMFQVVMILIALFSTALIIFFFGTDKIVNYRLKKDFLKDFETLDDKIQNLDEKTVTELRLINLQIRNAMDKVSVDEYSASENIKSKIDRLMESLGYIKRLIKSKTGQTSLTKTFTPTPHYRS